MTKRTGSRRRKRDYPHGSGDRNSGSPSGSQRMPIQQGGIQRDARASPQFDATGAKRASRPPMLARRLRFARP